MDPLRRSRRQLRPRVASQPPPLRRAVDEESSTTLDLLLSSLSDLFGRGEATPGSGSLAASVAAMSTAALVSVAEFSRKAGENGNGRYAESLPELLDIRWKLRHAVRAFTILARDDASEYAKSRHFRAEAQAARFQGRYTEAEELDRQADGHLRRATEIPLEAADQAVTLGWFAYRLLEIGYVESRCQALMCLVYAVSTVGMALSLACQNLAYGKPSPWKTQQIESIERLRRRYADLRSIADRQGEELFEKLTA